MTKQLVGIEKLLMIEVNRCITKAIVKFAIENGIFLIGVENLTWIKDKTNNNIKNKQKYIHNSWAFYRVQQFIEYKAKNSGLITEYMNPEYAAKTCCRCNISINRKKLIEIPLKLLVLNLTPIWMELET
jgi:putative transposase